MRAAFRQFRVAVLGGLLAALLAACATSGPPPRLHYGMADAPEGRSLMWPAAPEIPRYLFHGQLTGEGNFVRDEGEESGVGKFLRGACGDLSAHRPAPDPVRWRAAQSVAGL